MTPAARPLLGLDLGGSSVKAAVLLPADAGGTEPGASRIAARETRPLPAGREPDAVLDALAGLARELIAVHGRPRRVGLALPGLYDEADGTARLLPNLPASWTGFPVRERLAGALGVPVTPVNDARAFSLAESVLGAARGLSTVVCVVLGTGVGGGIVIDGRLLHGGRGSAGEVGHQTVVADGPRCGCGNRGCVEALISAEAVARLGGRDSVAEVYAWARLGDPRARRAVRRTIEVLGIALSNVYALLAPDAVVLGGGVAGSGDLLLRPLVREIRRRMYLVPPERVRVLPAALGRHAGAVGAALRAVE